MFQSSMKISCGTNNFLFNFTFSFLGFFSGEGLGIMV
jgi:hypothetical protein